MKWCHLHNQTLKSVFYLDENEETGIWLDKQQVHLIEQGNIYFELKNGKLLEVYISDSLEIHPIEKSFKGSISNNVPMKNTYWDKISNKRIYKVQTYLASQSVTSNGKTYSQEVISTVELIFTNGERVFISNAGLIEKDIIISLMGDLVTYSKKHIGIELDLI